MKINKGDTLEEISLPKPDGSIFNLSETKGKKVLLTFYRIAGCSFCNLRLNELNKRFSEFGNISPTKSSGFSITSKLYLLTIFVNLSAPK